jgi:hypothetical protein
MSWIALPAALDIVVKCLEPNSSQVESSIQFLYSMGNRYRGARFIAWLLSEATHGAVLENRNCIEENLDLVICKCLMCVVLTRLGEYWREDKPNY